MSQYEIYCIYLCQETLPYHFGKCPNNKPVGKYTYYF